MLANNTSITKLLLSSNDIGDKGALAFTANHTLKWLDISSNHISLNAQQTLHNDSTIETLIVSPQNIDDGDEDNNNLIQVR
jgi:hypothetical protein